MEECYHITTNYGNVGRSNLSNDVQKFNVTFKIVMIHFNESIAALIGRKKYYAN